MLKTCPCWIWLTVSCLALTQMVHVREQSPAVQRANESESLKYLMYSPVEAADSKKRDSKTPAAWPLVLFLHGGGEGGNDLEKVKQHGLPKLIEGGKSFPFFVVSPQNPSETQFWDDQQLIRLVDEIVQSHPIDESRIYLTGLSRGAFGAWRLAVQNPDRFAAVVPISGGGPLPYVQRLKHVPIWAFHGQQDTVIPCRESQRLVDELNRVGGNVKLTLYPKAGHDAWTETYENPQLYEWLLQQKKPATVTR